MLFIITRDGDKLDVQVKDSFAEDIKATIKFTQEGFVSYDNYHRFMDDNENATPKRMLLVEGKVI